MVIDTATTKVIRLVLYYKEVVVYSSITHINNLITLVTQNIHNTPKNLITLVAPNIHNTCKNLITLFSM